jgi:hypothetical protein
MIKHGFVPYIQHSVRLEYLLETVSSESAECDGKKTKQSCDPKKCNRHLGDNSRVFDAPPTVFQLFNIVPSAREENIASK